MRDMPWDQLRSLPAWCRVVTGQLARWFCYLCGVIDPDSTVDEFTSGLGTVHTHTKRTEVDGVVRLERHTVVSVEAMGDALRAREQERDGP
jgi:hypothetical protein